MEERKSMLTSLFDGEFFPAEYMTINNPDFRERNKIAERSRDRLDSTLSAEQKELLDRYVGDELYAQSALITQGFKVGVKTAIEIFKELDSIAVTRLDRERMLQSMFDKD